MTSTKAKLVRSPSVDRMRKISENMNPNVASSIHYSRKSPSHSSKAKKMTASSFSDAVPAPASKGGAERKFLVAKKNKKPNPEKSIPCKCEETNQGTSSKCHCVAYETLRASQEEFFKTEKTQSDDTNEVKEAPTTTEETNQGVVQMDQDVKEEKITQNRWETDHDLDSKKVISPRKSGSEVLEEALSTMPEQGFGRVRHLVKAFESLFLFRLDGDHEDDNCEDTKASKGIKWALPGLQRLSEEASSLSKPFSLSSSCEFINNTWKSGTDSMVFKAVRSNSERSFGSKCSNESRRNRRSSVDASGRIVRKISNKPPLRVTTQKPFNLITEQRGKQKEEEFLRRMQEILIQEERLRIPIAQGLPWTTDEPECVVKPHVKESTRPLDIRLYTDIRAAERAEFDQAVAEKMSLIEQYRVERERLDKLAEEEEVKQLRKQLVPRAQPMPYFDRPFIPKRSSKHPTIPQEPKFHISQHKKIKCMSWNDISFYQNIV